MENGQKQCLTDFNFSLEIADLSKLVVKWDHGCEDAVLLLGPEDQKQEQCQQPQGLSGPTLYAQLSRDSSGRLRLRVSCNSDQTAAAPADRAPVSVGSCQPLEVEVLEADDSDDAVRVDNASEGVQRDSNASNDGVAEASSSSYASAMEEFVATERTYVRRLGLVYDVYYPGLQTAVQERRLICCNQEDLKRIFGHFQGMQLLHEQLLSDLLEGKQQLGQLMCQYGHQLKSYSTYYSMFPQITSTVRGWMTDEAFRREFIQLRQQGTNPAEAQLDLRGLLLEPVQRPMRYPMLLDRYLEEIGSGHSDFTSARRAANTVLESLHELEKSLRDFSAFQERLQLLRSVAFPAAMAPHWEEFAHSCLRHGRAWQEDKLRYLLLSKRTLLICRPSRFRQETWMAKRALALPGDLRVLGCEGRILRMDTDRDAILQLEFGCRKDEAEEEAGSTGSISSECGSDAVRECREWAKELRRLGVPFVDSPAEADDRLLPWERAAGRSGRPVMTPPDKVTRCQGCGATNRLLQRRRLSCRVCGGAFCSDCTSYQTRTNWGGDQQLRCCFFCRIAAGAELAELIYDKHRQLLARFRSVRALDENSESLTGQVIAWMSGRSVSLWCRMDSEGRQLALYKHRRDFLPVMAIQQPKLRCVSKSESPDGTDLPTELLVHDHQKHRDCRLRSTTGEHSNLLGRLADLLGRCTDDLDGLGVDTVDAHLAQSALTPPTLAPPSPLSSPLASLSPSPLPFGDDAELTPKPR